MFLVLFHFFCIVATLCDGNNIFAADNFIDHYLRLYSATYDDIEDRIKSSLSVEAHHQRGVDAYMQQHYEEARHIFETLLAYDPTHADALFHLGLINKQYGHFHRAGELYSAAITHDPSHVKAHLNFATLFHSFGNIPEAIEQYNAVINNLLGVPADVEFIAMIKTNLITAHYQLGNYTSAFEEMNSLLDILLASLENNHCASYDLFEPHDYSTEACDILFLHKASLISMLFNMHRSLAYFKDMELISSYLLRTTLNEIQIREVRQYVLRSTPVSAINIVRLGPLLPFETLLLPVSLYTKQIIGVAASSVVLSAASAIQRNPTTCQRSEQHKLRIGFISHDFNNHPTAHLVEALFALRSDHVELYAYNYGVNDGSVYYENIKSMSYRFYDIADWSHAESLQLIQSNCLDVLLDMQIHTLGHRLELTAAAAVPTQINYLVYPGTSGSTFLQYIVADPIVAPPEHSNYYTESLLLLPPSYQISIYNRLVNEINTYKHNRERIVLCNFNKIDKLDFESMSLWLQVMQQIPTSVLWLLRPVEKHYSPDKPRANNATITQQATMVERHLHAFAASMGIAPHRIVFLGRVSKEEHVRRHGDVDLFLDTLTYGAHSTATDALKGGLPVLTMLGDSFPGRVGVSLLTALSSSDCDLSEYLVAYSSKEYVKNAVRLLRNPVILHHIRKHLRHMSENNRGLFDTASSAKVFYRSMSTVRNVEMLSTGMMPLRKRPHIIVNK